MKLLKSLSTVLLALKAHLRREECHNIASSVGTHATGALPLECSIAPITQRYLLVGPGAGANQFILNSATTRPWGVCSDEPQIGEQATILLLGCMPGTMKMVCGGFITAGSPVYTAAGGKVTSTFSATAYMVGRAITSAFNTDDLLEVAHCFPLLNATAL